MGARKSRAGKRAKNSLWLQKLRWHTHTHTAKTQTHAQFVSVFFALSQRSAKALLKCKWVLTLSHHAHMPNTLCVVSVRKRQHLPFATLIQTIVLVFIEIGAMRSELHHTSFIDPFMIWRLGMQHDNYNNNNVCLLLWHRLDSFSPIAITNGQPIDVNGVVVVHWFESTRLRSTFDH